MPTYDYECSKCGHNFDEFQSITSEPKAKCPKCGSNAKRIISAGAGLIFKGSGFYITDYKKKEQKSKTTKSDKSKPKEKKTDKKSPKKSKK
jgi:putative FmdB family regulatory protein